MNATFPPELAWEADGGFAGVVFIRERVCVAMHVAMCVCVCVAVDFSFAFPCKKSGLFAFAKKAIFYPYQNAV